MLSLYPLWILIICVSYILMPLIWHNCHSNRCRCNFVINWHSFSFRSSFNMIWNLIICFPSQKKNLRTFFVREFLRKWYNTVRSLNPNRIKKKDKLDLWIWVFSLRPPNIIPTSLCSHLWTICRQLSCSHLVLT